MRVYGVSNMIDHIDMILGNQPQIKSMSLRLYDPKGSPMDHSESLIEDAQEKNMNFWIILNLRLLEDLDELGNFFFFDEHIQASWRSLWIITWKDLTFFKKLTRPNRPQTLGFYLPDISLQTKSGGINFWSQAQILAYAGPPAQILSSLVFGVGSEF